MKERPILFNGEMVRAILDGRKTQTRRIVKNPEYLGCLTGDCPHEKQINCEKAMLQHSPFGISGDRLWVRETFGCIGRAPSDGPPSNGEESTTCYQASDSVVPHIIKWRPSIHMPRWASRINLEITSLRIERLNDISEEDARSEGVEAGTSPLVNWPKHEFMNLWESVYGSESWNSNPWVWVVEFKKK